MLAAFAAGFVDSIAGGGGLITVPTLLASGMPPSIALATNKLQSTFGTFWAALYFWKKGFVDLSAMTAAIVLTFIGSAIGTLMVQFMDSAILNRILPVLLIATALYFLCSPKVTNQDSKERLKPPLFALLIGTSVGFYDGFFGPGTGSFFAIAFVGLAGYGITKATANTKVLNFTSNFASLLFFAVGGHVAWVIGFMMAAANLAGAHYGSRMAITHGTKLIKPLLVTVSTLISARLIWQNYF